MTSVDSSRTRAAKRVAAIAATLAVTLTGCASFDPYNIIGRHAPPTASHDRDGFVRMLDEAAVREERRANVALVWALVRDRYYRADLNGVDWRAARAKWEPLIVAAPSEEEYWSRLDRMVGELADAHTRVESPLQVEARRRDRNRTLGIAAREMENRLIATQVNADSDAYFAGLRPGMTIRRLIDSVALERWHSWIAEARKSSTEQATRSAAIRRLNELARAAPEGVEIEFERFDGTLERARIKPRDARTQASVSHRVLPSGLGYVRLTGFSEMLRAELLGGIDALKDTPGLILDLRGNRGGSLALADALTGAFFKEKTQIGKATTRRNEPVSLAFGAIELISIDRTVPGRNDAYTGKVAVLIDRDSASASETVANALQSNARARVVGETSCGCMLAFLGYAKLNGGGELAYSEVGFKDKFDEIIEGRGVKPDIYIERTREDFQLARDPVMEAAVRSLLQ